MSGAKDHLVQLLADPKASFDHPSSILSADLTKDEKIKVLEAWRADAEALQRASAEAMNGVEHDLLQDVNAALLELGAKG